MNVHRLVAALSLAALALGSLGTVHGQQRHVLVVELDGVINSVTEGFISRALEKGEKEGAELVIIQLDTPGGLLDSTFDIVKELLDPPVPVAVYVAPQGALAASAGTFITAAANFAVMAPGTHFGAASPVGAGGEELPETLASKVMNDAAAEMRSIADRRGRDGDRLEETVRQATSYTAQEAVQPNAEGLSMVDFIAEDLSDLLRQVDGKTAVTSSGTVVLDTQGLEVRTLKLSMVEQLLMFLADPNVSFLLLSLGGLGLFVELMNPGLIVPGVVGVILLLLAFLALGNLPVNWAGVAFILLAVALAFLEVQVAGFGVLGVGAAISFIIGGLLLFFHTGAPSPTMPRIGVSMWVLAPTAAALVLGGGWALSTIVRSRRMEPVPTAPSLVGATGYATTTLDPRGTVQVASETWTAVAEGGQTISQGEAVTVVQVEGLILTVRRAE